MIVTQEPKQAKPENSLALWGVYAGHQIPTPAVPANTWAKTLEVIRETSLKPHDLEEQDIGWHSKYPERRSWMANSRPEKLADPKPLMKTIAVGKEETQKGYVGWQTPDLLETLQLQWQTRNPKNVFPGTGPQRCCFQFLAVRPELGHPLGLETATDQALRGLKTDRVTDRQSSCNISHTACPDSKT